MVWEAELTGGLPLSLCRAIGAEVLIDDNPRYAVECAQEGIHVSAICFGCVAAAGSLLYTQVVCGARAWYRPRLPIPVWPTCPASMPTGLPYTAGAAVRLGPQLSMPYCIPQTTHLKH